jgi:hypothetical protein
VDFRTETLRTKLEQVHFGSGIETRVFFSGKKKINHYENESIGMKPTRNQKKPTRHFQLGGKAKQ